MPRVLLAPDKFKGSLTAVEICAILQRALPSAWAPLGQPDPLLCDPCPISDGGEGFVQAVKLALGGTEQSTQVPGPLGETVAAIWAGCGQVAVAEMAAASGLLLVPECARDPWRASTAGTGVLLRDIFQRGHRRVMLGIGGSATNDGGCGLALALGFQFQDASGEPVTRLPEDLTKVRRIVPPPRCCWPEIVVACDVQTPLLGEHGATRIFGPQKGVPAHEVAAHEARLQHLVELVRRDVTPMPLEMEPGSGAAGGLGYGLRVFCGATLRPGLEMLAESAGLQERICQADVVIAGEGRLDFSSLEGKGPVALAEMAAEAGRPVIFICGAVDPAVRKLLVERGAVVLPITPEGLPMAEAVRRAPALLEAAAPQLAAAIRQAVSP